MANRLFRDYLPYHTISEKTPIVISTETTPTFVEMVHLNILDSLPAGQYVLVIAWEWSMPTVGNGSALFQVISPEVTNTVYQHEPKDSNDRIYRSTALPIDFTGGPLSILAQASRTAGATADLTIHQSSIMFERKA